MGCEGAFIANCLISDDMTLVAMDPFDLFGGDDDPKTNDPVDATGETLIGTDAPDTLTRGDLDDALIGLGGDDLLIGGAGNDGIEGNTGDDMRGWSRRSSTPASNAQSRFSRLGWIGQVIDPRNPDRHSRSARWRAGCRTWVRG